MTKIEAFKAWAPDGVLWTEWAKPVLFAGASFSEPLSQDIPDIHWLNFFRKDTALIIDLPEQNGILEGLALAQLGYRPIPLYNGVYTGSLWGNYMCAINTRNLAAQLFAGAEILSAVTIRPDAPPAFLIDSLRMNGMGKIPGTFDNRWCVFPQDLPSAAFLNKQGIKNVIVRTDPDRAEKIQNDLSHVLCRYQEGGVKIQHTDGSSEAQDIMVSRPSQFKSLFYRFKVLLGLSRNAAGGFGGVIPDPQTSDGGRYYGMG
jgi:hypothetical protein